MTTPVTFPSHVDPSALHNMQQQQQQPPPQQQQPQFIPQTTIVNNDAAYTTFTPSTTGAPPFGLPMQQQQPLRHPMEMHHNMVRSPRPPMPPNNAAIQIVSMPQMGAPPGGPPFMSTISFITAPPQQQGPGMGLQQQPNMMPVEMNQLPQNQMFNNQQQQMVQQAVPPQVPSVPVSAPPPVQKPPAKKKKKSQASTSSASSTSASNPSSQTVTTASSPMVPSKPTPGGAKSKLPKQPRLSAAALKQKQESDYYQWKHRLLKRTIKALVYKNAALCDEVARLNQRISTVVEERRVLGKRLIHHERLKLKRQANAQKRLEAQAKAQQAAAAAAAVAMVVDDRGPIGASADQLPLPVAPAAVSSLESLSAPTILTAEDGALPDNLLVVSS